MQLWFCFHLNIYWTKLSIKLINIYFKIKLKYKSIFFIQKNPLRENSANIFFILFYLTSTANIIIYLSYFNILFLNYSKHNRNFELLNYFTIKKLTENLPWVFKHIIVAPMFYINQLHLLFDETNMHIYILINLLQHFQLQLIKCVIGRMGVCGLRFFR